MLLHSDYANQGARFEVFEGIGCTDAPVPSILEVLVLESWEVILPLISVIFYYRDSIIFYFIVLHAKAYPYYSKSGTDLLSAEQGYHPRTSARRC